MNKTKEGRPFCPECGKPATGNFCQTCGAKLGGRFCNQCGNKLSAGAKFCNQCGATASGSAVRAGAHRAAAAAAVGGHNLAWWVAGAAMFVVIVFIGTSMVRSEGPSVPPAAGGSTAGAPSAGGAAGVDLTQMTPIQAADRLYDRIMRAIAAGDSAQAQQFMPMALNAYERAQPLTHDGLFHLSLLQRVGFQAEDALASARQILDDDPDHLLGLVAAAEAAQELGRGDEAADYYGQIVAVYDEEMADPLPEYLDHSAITEPLKAQAEAFLAGR